MKYVKSLIAATVVAGTLVGGSLNILAADNDTTSDALVNFKADDDGTTKPVDPTNPDENVEPKDPVNPSKGALRIDYASTMNFGTQVISGKDENYFVKYTPVTTLDGDGNPTGNEKYVPSYVQVTDNRGTNTGWELTVTGSAFKDGANNELQGAELTLENVQLASQIAATYKPGFAATQVVVNDSPTTLVKADANEGMSTWTAAFGSTPGTSSSDTNKNIKLHVPASAKKIDGATYTSTLTWTINATP